MDTGPYSYQQSTVAPPAILQLLQAHRLKQPLAQHASGLSKHCCTAHTASYHHSPTLSQLTNQSIHSAAHFRELHSRLTLTRQPLLPFWTASTAQPAQSTATITVACMLLTDPHHGFPNRTVKSVPFSMSLTGLTGQA